eukprot:s1089_g8.t1
MLTDPALLLPWVGWFYPLILLFLYTMFRAAAVTEKASRVAPLINAWTFHDPDQDEEQDTCWMDQDRQYVVQYINHFDLPKTGEPRAQKVCAIPVLPQWSTEPPIQGYFARRDLKGVRPFQDGK